MGEHLEACDMQDHLGRFFRIDGVGALAVLAGWYVDELTDGIGVQTASWSRYVNQRRI